MSLAHNPVRPCRYRARLPHGWTKVPCGREAVEGAEHCSWHHRRCHDTEPHGQHTWTPKPPAHMMQDVPGSLTCPGNLPEPGFPGEAEQIGAILRGSA